MAGGEMSWLTYVHYGVIMHVQINRAAPKEENEFMAYAGRILIAEAAYILVVSPKAEGEHDATAWNDSPKCVEGALSYCDGLTNTQAMAAAGSKLAKWALGLSIGDYSNWYIPSQDELEICYRAFKPTNESNWLYARSGINMSAVPPTHPYSKDAPGQTTVQQFRAGGAEAFAPATIPYWSSTQHAGKSICAWGQDFVNGGQCYWGKDVMLRARAVRRLAI